MPHSSSWRASGSINANNRKNVNITKNSSVAKDLEHLFDTYEDIGSAKYQMGGIDFTGKIDYFYKVDNLILGTGVGYKDGIYHHFTLGVNLLYFELGGFIGAFHQYSELEYEGKTCNDEWYYDENKCRSFYDEHRRYNHSLLGGIFAGLYFDKIFFNYSVSTYKPNPEIEGDDDYDMDVPGIATNYFTVGYRLNRWIEFSIGSNLTYIGSANAWNYGFSGGISFYLK